MAHVQRNQQMYADGYSIVYIKSSPSEQGREPSRLYRQNLFKAGKVAKET